MLSNEEKQEMLKDAESKARREHFEAGKEEQASRIMPLDEYISFLDNVQEIFGPFKISTELTHTELNKL